MNSDYLRGVSVSARGGSGVNAAVTYTTDWIDTASVVGPVVFRAEAASSAGLSYVFKMEDATSSAGAGSADVAQGDVTGGEGSGAATNGSISVAVNNDLSHALGYNGSKRYVRGSLAVAKAAGAGNVSVSLVGLSMPQITPAR